MKKTTVLGIFCSLLAFNTAYAADLEAGKATAAICAGCHGADGHAANPEWPNLAGQNVKYIENQLKSFQNGNRKNELMSPMAQSLSADDIANVAAYFNSLK
ncbi:MAG: cytochrome c [Gammaproteobacteria bacterium]|nr:cytochrome c [Gammaproteobacteria bacterium]